MTRAVIEGEFHLTRALHDDLVARARADHPYEVCGLLAGGPGSYEHFPMVNAARSMTYYSMEPKQLLEVMNEMDDRGLELAAIYHSHTHTEAFPSATDVELAFYPDAVYLIISLQDGDAPVLRAFDIVGGRITERTLLIDGRPAPTGPR